MDSPQSLFKKYGLRPNKLMGQNFLISEDILNDIIDAADLSLHDTVLEAGPGLGILTVALAQRARRVIAVEKDKKIADALKKYVTGKRMKNIEIVEGDILLYRDPTFVDGYKVVANLPYYLTSRFLRKFLSEEAINPAAMILMVQKEVAERIIARPPHMNLLALSVQAYGKPEIVKKTPASAFWPKPKVDSAIIKITNISDDFFSKNGIDQKKFFTLLKTAFSQKRKKLSNSLGDFFGDKKTAEKKIKKTGLVPNSRPEEFSLENWGGLFKSLE